jgi:cytosine/adenosine deaminase-related metal-dependent hydrolase
MRTVFTGVRLIDGTGAAPVDAAAVVIEAGTFTYAGPACSRPAATDETVIDLGGRTLLPGFFDCHVHFLMDSNADFTGRRWLVVCDGNPVADVGLLGEPDNVVLVVQGGSIIKDRLPAPAGIRPGR